VKKRDIAFGIFGLIFAIVCIRLGIWQLQRLSDRKHLNTELRSRAATRPVDLAALPKDTGEAHFRRVVISGTYDYDHEITLTNRSRNGSPGVNIITPLRGMSDTAILVNRGWVYAPDGMTVDLARWRETSSMNGDGYVEFFRKGNGTAKSATHERAYRWVDDRIVTQAFPYPVRPYLVVLIDDSTKRGENIPPRVDVPPLDEGPHKSYAIQWYSFAAISIVGTVLYLRRK
jgi:surfeit locus 1 family protein